jgi:hypothetical protein
MAWWDVITSPIQQAVQNVQQTVSNIISPPTPQPSQTIQGGSGGGAGYTNAIINPSTNQPVSAPAQIYSPGGTSYTPSPQTIGNQIVSGIQNLPQTISAGIQNLPQTVQGGLASGNQQILGITGIGVQGLPQTPQGAPIGFGASAGDVASKINLPTGYGMNLVGGAVYTPVMIDQYNTKNPAMVFPSYSFAGSTVTEPAQSKIPSVNLFGFQTPEINLSSVMPRTIGAATAFLYPGTTTTYSQQSTYASPKTELVKTDTYMIPGGTMTEKFYNTTGGVQNEITRTQSQAPSGFEALQGSLSERAYSGYGSLFGLTGEQAKTALSIVGTQTKEMANVVPSMQNIEQAAGSAVLKYGFDKPLEAGVNVAIAAATAGVFELGGVAFGGSRAIAAERIIGTGQTARAVELVTGTAWKYAPAAFGALYGTSVIERSTEGGKELGAGSITAKAAPIGVFEVAPMVYGFGLPSKASEAYAGIKEGYAAFKLEAMGAKPASMIVDMEGNLVMSGGAIERTAPTFGQYARAKVGEALDTSYVTSRGGLLADISSVPKRIGNTVNDAAIKGDAASIASRMNEAVIRAAEKPAAAFGEAVTKVASNPKVSPEVQTIGSYDVPNIEVVAYGKQDVFAAIDKAMGVVPSEMLGRQSITAGGTQLLSEPYPRAFVSEGRASELSRIAYPEAGAPLSTRVGMRASELVNELATRTSLKYSAYPEAEIARLNANARMGISQTMEESIRGASTTPYGKTISGTNIGKTFEGSRMTGTKTIGGVETTALAKEPSRSSVRTTDVGGTTTRTQLGTRTDFRGQQGAMKPMKESSLGYQGKQASGASALSEVLPKVEGMPATRQAAPQGTIPFMLPTFAIAAYQPSAIAARTETVVAAPQAFIQAQLVQVLGADMPVTQESQRRQESAIMPAFAIASGQKSDVVVSPISDVLSRSMQQQATQQMVASQSKPASDVLRMSESASGRYQVPDVASNVRSESIITPISEQRQSQIQRTTEIVPTRQTTIERGFVPIIPPVIIPPIFPGGLGGGGGGASGLKNQRRSRFTDIFLYGQGIGDFGSVKPLRFGGYSPQKPKKK